MKLEREQLEPGRRVVVVQQIPQRSRVWTTRVAGTIEQYEQRKTGSWYAHSKDDRLWLDRLIIRKDDGEIVSCILDEYTHIEAVEPAGTAAKAAHETTEPAAEAAPEA